MEQEDEVVYCTGTVTDSEIAALKKRIANGTTTADDVVLLDRLLCQAQSYTQRT